MSRIPEEGIPISEEQLGRIRWLRVEVKVPLLRATGLTHPPSEFIVPPDLDWSFDDDQDGDTAAEVTDWDGPLPFSQPPFHLPSPTPSDPPPDAHSRSATPASPASPQPEISGYSSPPPAPPPRPSSDSSPDSVLLVDSPEGSPLPLPPPLKGSPDMVDLTDSPPPQPLASPGQAGAADSDPSRSPPPQDPSSHAAEPPPPAPPASAAAPEPSLALRILTSPLPKAPAQAPSKTKPAKASSPPPSAASAAQPPSTLASSLVSPVSAQKIDDLVAKYKETQKTQKKPPAVVPPKPLVRGGKRPREDGGVRLPSVPRPRSLAEQGEKEALVEQTLAKKLRLESEDPDVPSTSAAPEERRPRIKVKPNPPRLVSPPRAAPVPRLTPVDLFHSPPRRSQDLAKKLVAKASRPESSLFKTIKRRVAHSAEAPSKVPAQAQPAAPAAAAPAIPSSSRAPVAAASASSSSPGEEAPGVLSQIMGEMEEGSGEVAVASEAHTAQPAQLSIFGLGSRPPPTAPPPLRKKSVRWRAADELVQERPISPRHESAYWLWAKGSPSCLDNLLDEGMARPPSKGAESQARSPFEDSIRTTILAWNRDWLDQFHRARLASQGKTLPPPILTPSQEGPNSFTAPKGLPEGPVTLDQYHKAFQELILCEIWESLYERFVELESKSPVERKTNDLELVCERYETASRIVVLHLAGLVNKSSPERSALLSAYDSSLICADLQYGNTARAPRPVFGFVYADSLEMEDVPRTEAIPPALRPAWDTGERFRDVKTAVQVYGWANLRSVRFKLILRRAMPELGKPWGVFTRPFLNFTTAAREMKGVECVGQSPLGPAILAPEEKHLQLPTPSQPALLTECVQKLNASQTEAVTAIAEDVARPATAKEPRLSLVHGPPGTGKSRTIVSLVLETRARVAPSTDRHGLILVTAPSNGAVDELARSLIRASDRHKDHSFSFLRFGTDEGVARDVQSHSLEHKVRLKAANPNCKVEKELAELEKRLADLKPGDPEAKVLRRHRDFVDKKRRSLSRERSESVRKELLSKVDVVATTLSSAASPVLAALHRERKLLLVVVDEACQATEPEVLIPLAFGRTAKLVLVGDPEQLPPTLRSQWAGEGGLSRALFGRLRQTVPTAVSLLDTQYRMHRDIAAHPSTFFYGGALRTAEEVERRAALLSSAYTCLDFRFGEGERAARSSQTNETEAKAVVEIVRHLRRELGGRLRDVGVLSFYSAQVELIGRLLRQAKEDGGVETRTVDGFQGREKSVLLISCVRTRKAGFLEDKRRLNVALTRGRDSVVVLGSLDTLARLSTVWGALRDDAHERRRLFPVRSAPQLVSVLRAQLRRA